MRLRMYVVLLPATRTLQLTALQHGVLVFRKAALDDARHVAFSALFGELDDVKPYLTLGRKNRFSFDELFDVSNLEDDGSLVQVGSKRDHTSRVCNNDKSCAHKTRAEKQTAQAIT